MILLLFIYLFGGLASYLLFELFGVALTINNYVINPFTASFFWPLTWVLILWSIILHIKHKLSGKQ